MKKLLTLLCIAAIAVTAYAVVTAPEQEREAAMEAIEAEAGELAGQAQDLYQEYGVEVVEEANEAINDAMEGAVEGAADNFWESMKQSVAGFFDDLFSD